MPRKIALPLMNWLSHERRATVHTDYARFMEEAALQAIEPVGGSADPYVRTLAEATPELVQRYPEFAEAIGDLLLRRPIKRHEKDERGVSASAVFGEYRTCLVSNALEAHIYDPHGPNILKVKEPTVQDWLDEADRMLAHSLRKERFWTAMCTLNTPTTIGERQAPVYVVSQMLGALSVLSVGSSIQHGEARLLHADVYPFRGSEVVVRKPREYKGERPIVQDLHDSYHSYLRRPPNIERIDTVDMLNAYDPVIRLMAKGALRVQRELLSPAFMQRFNALTTFIDEQRYRSDSRLAFHRMDFSDPQAVEKLHAELGGRKANLVTFVTMLNQVAEPAVRYAMLEHAESFWDPEDEHAATLLIDFFYKKGRKLVPHEHWGLWDYNVYIIQKQDKTKTPQRLFVAESSRMGRLAVGEGSLIVDGKRRKFEHLLRGRYIAGA